MNRALPQFPVGTQVALVRQAILIDTNGEPVPTALIEDIQLRVYHAVTPQGRWMNFINGPSSHDQDFFEFQMNRPRLFARHNGGLVAVGPTERGYATFRTHGIDPFEFRAVADEGPGVILNRCVNCHSDSGIHSVQSRLQWMKSWENAPATDEDGDPIAWETRVTLAQKRQSPEFLLLQRWWSGARD